MKHKHNIYKFKGSYLKRYAVPIIGIILIVILMAVIKFFNSAQSDETTREELPIPEEIKEQGAPELPSDDTDPKV